MSHFPQGALRRAAPLDFARTALFLDLDGTLAPIEQRPEAVGPDPRRTELLRRLEPRLGGRLAVVSGREIATVDRILGGAVQAVAGVHGLERRLPGGGLVRARPSPGLVLAGAALREFAADRPGVLIEDKGLSLALHYRLAPDAADAAEALAERLAGAAGLKLQRGDMVAELRTPGADKGAAVEAFMSEPPFRGALPLFVGDDLTDEDGFQAALRFGGTGVLVGPSRATAARARLEDAADVLDWLEASLG